MVRIHSCLYRDSEYVYILTETSSYREIVNVNEMLINVLTLSVINLPFLGIDNN